MLRKIFRWVGFGVAGLLGLIVLALIGIYAVSSVRMNKTYTIAPEALAVSPSQADIEHGQRIVATIGQCGDCHGPNLAGTVMIDDPMLGRLTAPNLTSGKGGIGGTFTDVDWIRAIRHGVGPDGKGLKIMPAGGFYHFSDADLAAVIAYVKSQPAVDNDLPSTDIRLLGRALYVAGALPLFPAENIPHDGPRPETVQPGATAEYGRYLTTVGSCNDCHGARLAGGPLPGASADTPVASNLTPGGEVAGWSKEEFRRALREGVTPTGHQLDDEMPWKTLGNLSDDELDAIWLYLKTLPPLKFNEN